MGLGGGASNEEEVFHIRALYLAGMNAGLPTTLPSRTCSAGPWNPTCCAACCGGIMKSTEPIAGLFSVIHNPLTAGDGAGPRTGSR